MSPQFDDHQDPFCAYQGFLQLIPKQQLRNWISQQKLLERTIEDIKRHPDAPAEGSSLFFHPQGTPELTRGYRGVRLIDSYIDVECVPLNNLVTELLHKKIHGEDAPPLDPDELPPVRLQILLMSPFSHIGALRHDALSLEDDEYQSALERSIRSLRRIRKALREHADAESASDDKDPAKRFVSLLDEARALGKQIGVEVRFFDRFAEAPVYFFGKFVLKGVILDKHSAAHNPWMVFVDDPNQRDDLYDSMVQRADSLWDEAYCTPSEFGFRELGEEDTLCALAIMPMNDETQSRYEAMKQACEQVQFGRHRIELMRVDDEPDNRSTINEQIVNCIHRADVIIADLSETRPNVYFEAGLAHGTSKPILYVAKSGTEVEFDLRNYHITHFDSDESLVDGLSEGLTKLGERLHLIFPEASTDP